MKKFITTIVTLLLTINALALNVWDGTATPWTNGSGTESDPYLIETAANLAYLAQKVNEGYQASGQAVFEAVYFLMTDDFDLNNINWTPIGNVNMNMVGFYFAGVFDGWYHNIDHLKIQSSADVCGLFAGLGGEGYDAWDSMGLIINLSVTNGNISSTGTGVGGIVGGIAGNAQVWNCSFSGIINVNNNGSYCGVGGIAAAAAEDSYIGSCSFHGSITATNNGGFTGAAGAGGVVGIAMDNALITDCYNTGTISANAMLLSVAAGIVGATLQENNIVVKNCYNVGTVNASTKGGIFGMISPINPTKNEKSLTVIHCFYLNTCGGTTNYGTSMTSDQMKTEDFKNQLNQVPHTFVMDNGTNSGYPILSLHGLRLFGVNDITSHTAKISGYTHEGNDDVVRARISYGIYERQERDNIDVPIDGFFEIVLEDLEPNTIYYLGLTIQFADSLQVFSANILYFETHDNTGISEISNSDIFIYPNPTSDFIFIENIEPQLVTIYSLDGKLVKSVENADIVDVRDLESGLYLINIDGAARKIQIK